MTVIQCEMCGRPTEQQIFCPDGDIWHILCLNCASWLNSCNFCKEANTCAFENNSSSIPKMIQQRIQQGPITSVVMVKNPELVRQTCQSGCPCYSPEFECMRQFNYCKNLKYIYKE